MTPFLIVVIGFLILLPLVAWQDEKRLAKRQGRPLLGVKETLAVLKLGYQEGFFERKER